MANGIQSIKNNLIRCKNQKFQAAEAIFYIRRLKEETGIPMQKLIARLLITGFRNDPEYSLKYEEFRKEFLEGNFKKDV